MEKEGYQEFLDNIVDPGAAVADMPNDKLWMLLGELDDILADYDREVAITYLSCNHSKVKHMCTTYLRGKHDAEIIGKMRSVRDFLQAEVLRRRDGRRR